MNIRAFLLMMAVICCCTIFPAAMALADIVELQDRGDYFHVTVDLSDAQTSRAEAGQALGAKIAQALPEIESLMDSYLQEVSGDIPLMYQMFLSRAQAIKPQIPEELRQELDAMAGNLCSADSNVMGDGKLSADELWTLNLAAEVLRLTQCSAVGVLPQASASGRCMLVRNLDWVAGSEYQLTRLQAVTVYTLPGGHSVTLIGYLGLVNCLSGFNEHGVFASILDSGTGRTPYTAVDKRAYTFDLRQALENDDNATVDQVAAAMQANSTQYTYGHLVFLGDPETVKVLENDLQQGGANLRSVDSAPLYHDWDVPDTIGAVNCNMLPASTNNAGDQYDIARWNSQQRLLLEDGESHSWSDLQELAGYGPGSGTDGYLYIKATDYLETQQIMVFEPATARLDVAFHPVGRGLADDETPEYTTINTGKNPAGAAPGILELLLR